MYFSIIFTSMAKKQLSPETRKLIKILFFPRGQKFKQVALATNFVPTNFSDLP